MQGTLLVLATLLVYSYAAICSNPQSYSGRALCDHSGGYCGECVSFYKICTNDRRTTSQWGQGRKVRGAGIAIGTGIATFPNGKYYGHAAIYMGQNGEGIQVWDQWKGHPVSQRTIRWGGSGISNNGDSFYVIDGAGGSSPSPPSSSGGSWGACTANGMSGRCIDTSSQGCSGQLFSGLCPGPSNVRCCAGGSSATIANDATTPSSPATSAADNTSALTAVVIVVGVIVVVMLLAVIVVLGKKIYA